MSHLLAENHFNRVMLIQLKVSSFEARDVLLFYGVYGVIFRWFGKHYKMFRYSTFFSIFTYLVWGERLLYLAVIFYLKPRNLRLGPCGSWIVPILSGVSQKIPNWLFSYFFNTWWRDTLLMFKLWNLMKLCWFFSTDSDRSDLQEDIQHESCLLTNCFFHCGYVLAPKRRGHQAKDLRQKTSSSFRKLHSVWLVNPVFWLDCKRFQ